MKPLDESFFGWLYSQVADPTVMDKSQSYWRLLRQFYSMEAVWLIPHDDNRLQDGKALRLEFEIDQRTETNDPEWMGMECSVLELMVGLARRLSFDDLAEREPRYWFWKMVENIGLRNCTDRSRFSDRRVENFVNRVLYREYDYDGHGGFFPLNNPSQDQRSVELWYQLSEYITEQNSN